MQTHTTKTGCHGGNCDLEQHVLEICIFVYGFHQVLIRSTARFYFVGLLFSDNLQTHLGVLLLGTLRYIYCCLFPIKTYETQKLCFLVIIYIKVCQEVKLRGGVGYLTHCVPANWVNNGLLMKCQRTESSCAQPCNIHMPLVFIIWVRSRNCGCIVTWFCYQLIAKPGKKRATV